MSFDIRNLIFCKPIKITNKPFENNFSNNYDAINNYTSIIPLKVDQKPQSILSNIDLNNKEIIDHLNGEFVFQSNYIICPIDNSNEAFIADFWNSSLKYLAVSFVFFNIEDRLSVKEFKAKQEELNEEIKSKIKNLSSKTHCIKFALYQSVNWCDSVILWKTNDINLVKNIIDNLSGKTCCFHRLICSIAETHYNGTKIKPLKSFQNLSAVSSVSEVYHILNTKNINVSVEQSKYDKQLYEICHTLYNTFKNMDFNNYLWKEPYSELLNILLNTSQSNILNNISFLLIDSASIFSKWTKKCLENDSPESFHNQLAVYENDILIYFRAWKELIGKTVKAETIFITNTCYQNTTYNFSVRMIEFYNAYLNKISEFLHHVDLSPDKTPNKDDEFSCLTVPKLCRRIKTRPIIPDDHPPCDSLLYVDLPFSLINDSFVVLTSLLHEISHLLTDKVRFREDRKKAFLRCLSLEICDNLNVEYIDVIQYVEKELQRHVSNCSISYLDEIGEELKFATQHFFAKDANFYNIADIFSKLHCQTDDEIYCLRKELIEDLDVYRKQYQTISEFDPKFIVDDLKFLFCECYADAVMVYTLDLSVEEYVKMFSSEARYFREDKKSSVGNEALLLQRILIVANAYQKAFGHSLKINDTSVDYPFFQEFIQFKKEYDNDSDDLSENLYLLTKSTIETISSYVAKCLVNIDKNNKNLSLKLCNEIRTIFRKVVDEDRLFEKDFDEFIYQNRLSILKKIQTSL